MDSILVLLGKQFSQTVEWFLPERSPSGDPALGDVEPLGLNAASAYPPRFHRAHQTTFLQHLQALNDGGERNGEGLRQFRDLDWSGAQVLYTRAACGVCHDMKVAV